MHQPIKPPPPPPKMMFTHHYDHISISAFFCLITGISYSVDASVAAAMAMNKYKYTDHLDLKETDGAVGGWLEHVWTDACSDSVCPGRQTQSWRLTVKLRIYAVESGKSLSASWHSSLSLCIIFSLRHWCEQVVASFFSIPAIFCLSGH